MPNRSRSYCLRSAVAFSGRYELDEMVDDDERVEAVRGARGRRLSSAKE